MNNYPDIKPEINPEHPHINKRNKNQQNYRNELSQLLKTNRDLGELWKRYTEDILNRERNTLKYHLAKEGIQRKIEKEEQINTFKKVAENLDKFQGLNNNFAKILIKRDQGKWVIEHLESFENLNYEEIAILLIQKKQWDIWKIKWDDQNIKKTLINNLEKFKNINYQKIAELLIKEKEWNHVVANLEKFKEIDYQKIAELLVKEGNIRTLAYNLKKFKGLDNHIEITKKIIKKWGWNAVAWNLKNFHRLNNTIKETLIKLWYSNEVEEYPEAFEQ